MFDKLMTKLIGMSEKDAKKEIMNNGMMMRIISRDGSNERGDMAHKINRVNLVITAGKVEKAYLG